MVVWVGGEEGRDWGRERWMERELKCSYKFKIHVVEPVNVVKFCIVLLFYVQGKHLRSCRDGQLT